MEEVKLKGIESPSPEKEIVSAHERLREIAAAVRITQKSSAISVPPNLVKDLFDLVPDLESIQKDARQRVVNQLTVRELNTGDILIHDEDNIKEFYLVVSGLLFYNPKSTVIDIKVFFQALPN